MEDSKINYTDPNCKCQLTGRTIKDPVSGGATKHELRLTSIDCPVHDHMNYPHSKENNEMFKYRRRKSTFGKLSKKEREAKLMEVRGILASKPGVAVSNACRRLKISTSTYYSYCKRHSWNPDPRLENNTSSTLRFSSPAEYQELAPAVPERGADSKSRFEQIIESRVSETLDSIIAAAIDKKLAAIMGG